ncbi:unnamed protein product [Closterium sp. NIES-65]|nr:unnamed protein product [Closterium sp. NIES-65]
MMTYEASLFVSFGSGFVPRCRPSVRLLSFRQVAVAPSGREEQRKGAIGEALTHLAEEQRKGAIVEALTHFSVLSANAMATGVTTTRMRLQLMKKYSELWDFWLTEEDVNPSAPFSTSSHLILPFSLSSPPFPSPSPSSLSPPPEILRSAGLLRRAYTYSYIRRWGGWGGAIRRWVGGAVQSGDGVGGAVQSGDGVGGAVQSGEGGAIRRGAVQSGVGVGGVVQSGKGWVGRCNQAISVKPAPSKSNFLPFRPLGRNCIAG